MSYNIGIDFGGVLSIHDSNIGAEHINTIIDVPMALESLMKLKGYGHKLYLISFCGKNRAIETKKSIEKYCPNLFDDIYFVKDRKYKKDICEYLNCDYMIDDREDILQEVIKSSCRTIPILFGGDIDSHFLKAKDWNDVLSIISNNDRVSEKKELVINIDKKIHKI